MASAVAAVRSGIRARPGRPGCQQPGGCRADTTPGTSDRHYLPSDLPAFVAGVHAGEAGFTIGGLARMSDVAAYQGCVRSSRW
jgi:hypothetical protein